MDLEILTDYAHRETDYYARIEKETDAVREALTKELGKL
jgi:hypothetical protein